MHFSSLSSPEIHRTNNYQDTTAVDLLFCRKTSSVKSYGFPLKKEKPTDFQREFLAVKLMALFNGLKGEFILDKYQMKIPLEGHSTRNFFSYFISFFSEREHEIKQACIQADNPNRSDEEIVNSIRWGDLLILSCGSKDHAIALVFLQEFLVICNRGDNLSSMPTMKSFYIDSKKFSKELLQRIWIISESYGWDADIAYFYYQELPQYLSVEMNRNILAIRTISAEIDSFSPARQKVGNCPAAAVKTAIRAALVLTEIYKTGSYLDDQQIQFIKGRCKDLSINIREKTISLCEEVFREAMFPTLKELIILAKNKILQKRLKRIRSLLSILPKNILTTIRG